MGENIIQQFWVINNRWPSSAFKLQRGVYQGCPLSSYLFVLAAEVLSIYIRRECSIKVIEVEGLENKVSQWYKLVDIHWHRLYWLCFQHFWMFPTCFTSQSDLWKNWNIPNWFWAEIAMSTFPSGGELILHGNISNKDIIINKLVTHNKFRAEVVMAWTDLTYKSTVNVGEFDDQLVWCCRWRNQCWHLLQFRKPCQLPYIQHPCQVKLILVSVWFMPLSHTISWRPLCVPRNWIFSPKPSEIALPYPYLP